MFGLLPFFTVQETFCATYISDFVNFIKEYLDMI